MNSAQHMQLHYSHNCLLAPLLPYHHKYSTIFHDFFCIRYRALRRSLSEPMEVYITLNLIPSGYLCSPLIELCRQIHTFLRAENWYIGSAIIHQKTAKDRMFIDDLVAEIQREYTMCMHKIVCYDQEGVGTSGMSCLQGDCNICLVYTFKIAS